MYMQILNHHALVYSTEDMQRVLLLYMPNMEIRNGLRQKVPNIHACYNYGVFFFSGGTQF